MKSPEGAAQAQRKTEIILETRINAPLQRCFDLARSIDFHLQSAAATREQVISGITKGLIGDGQEVEWRARHLGLWFRMRVRVTGFTPCTWFQDSMVEGPFERFTHDHNFSRQDSGTQMTDRIIFASSFPLLDRFLLRGHLRNFVQRRNEQLKAALESNSWQPYLQPEC